MAQPEHVIAQVYASLKPGGRFVFEMGGYHNIAHVLKSMALALSQFGLNDDGLINYYPKLGAYCTLLENAGFNVAYAETIDRPTQLEGKDGLINWVKMFRSHILEQVPESEHQAFFVALEKVAKPTLYRQDHWWADYVRLRVVAQKTN
jgi:trans-aconitate methyltransferase